MNKWIFGLAIIVVLGGMLALFALSGVYDVGADRPHWTLVREFIQTLRQHSVERRAQAIQVPPLDEPARVREGAEHYSAMCVDCHLAPGITVSEIRAGLAPAPPNLAEHSVDPRVAFWTIKHGIKMSGMPAWGKTHDDEEIWNIVSFVHQLPHLTVAAYREMTTPAEVESPDTGHETHDADHAEHHHAHDAAHH